MTENKDQETLYCEKYDAMYNPITDEWLEGKCDAPKCEFCAERPNRPSEVIND